MSGQVDDRLVLPIVWRCSCDATPIIWCCYERRQRDRNVRTRANNSRYNPSAMRRRSFGVVAASRNVGTRANNQSLLCDEFTIVWRCSITRAGRAPTIVPFWSSRCNPSATPIVRRCSVVANNFGRKTFDAAQQELVRTPKRQKCRDARQQ